MYRILLADAVDIFHHCLMLFILWGSWIDPRRHRTLRWIHAKWGLSIVVVMLLVCPLCYLSRMLRGEEAHGHLIPAFPFVGNVGPVGLMLIAVIVLAVALNGVMREHEWDKAEKNQNKDEAA